MPRGGFTLIEIIIVIVIIGILATVTLLALAPTQKSANDARRKIEISQIGRLLTVNCYVPDAGEGDYDLLQIVSELKAKYPNYSNFVSQTPRDPSKGSPTESFYRYTVDTIRKKCAVYANLQTEGEMVTLPDLSLPTPGGGTGVLQAGTPGWNGTTKYFQISN